MPAAATSPNNTLRIARSSPYKPATNSDGQCRAILVGLAPHAEKRETQTLCQLLQNAILPANTQETRLAQLGNLYWTLVVRIRLDVSWYRFGRSANRPHFHSVKRGATVTTKSAY
jgi:hypothetical protein